MIVRLLEPEVMETAEEVREYDAMDHGEVNARFVADFLAAHGPCAGGQILDVGTGTARIPIALTAADACARVLALDLSETMLAQAVINIDASGHSGRIKTYLGDAKMLLDTFGPRAFEGVISNTIIHHIPDPRPVLEMMAQLVAPRGTLMVRDLARPQTRSEISRLVDLYAGCETPRARALFDASLHAALSLDEIRAIVRDIGLPPADIVMTSDRHWTWTWRKV